MGGAQPSSQVNMVPVLLLFPEDSGKIGCSQTECDLIILNPEAEFPCEAQYPFPCLLWEGDPLGEARAR